METAWINDAARMLQTIGWTLIHSLWQAAIVYALLRLLFKAAPAMPARARYACGAVALGVITLWSIGTLYRHWPAPQAVVSAGYIPAVKPGAAGPALLRLLDESMPWLMMAYGLGLGLMIGRMLLGFAEIRRMRRSGFALGGVLAERLNALARRMGIRRAVLLRQSPLVAVPMVIGALRPMILLPPSCLETLSPAALEALLLHELAHIRRADFLVNILQTVVEAVLFFNPFVRRISVLLRREREHCCDDLVLIHSAHPFEYAAALASLAAAGRQPMLALAAADGRYPLLTRIKRITAMEKKSLRPGTVILVSGIAALLVAVSIVCFTPAFAQRKAKTATSSTKPLPPAPPAAHSATAVPVTPEPPSAPLDETDNPGSFAREAVTVGLDAADLALANMPELMDSVMGAASEAMRQVDWAAIRRELRNASREMETVDWNKIGREVNAAVNEATRDIDWNEARFAAPVPAAAPAPPSFLPAPAPPQNQRERARRYRERQRMTEEMRRDLAEARKEIEEARQEREEALASRHAERSKERSEIGRQREVARERIEEARRELEQAREEMESARQEMERAREELEKARQEVR